VDRGDSNGTRLAENARLSVSLKLENMDRGRGESWFGGEGEAEGKGAGDRAEDATRARKCKGFALSDAEETAREWPCGITGAAGVT